MPALHPLKLTHSTSLSGPRICRCDGATRRPRGIVVTVQCPTNRASCEAYGRRVERILRNLLVMPQSTVRQSESPSTWGHALSWRSAVRNDHGIGLRPCESSCCVQPVLACRTRPGLGRRLGPASGLSNASYDARLHGGRLQAWLSRKVFAVRADRLAQSWLDRTGSPNPGEPACNIDERRLP